VWHCHTDSYKNFYSNTKHKTQFLLTNKQTKRKRDCMRKQKRERKFVDNLWKEIREEYKRVKN
jgi:hypothetical protein